MNGTKKNDGSSSLFGVPKPPPPPPRWHIFAPRFAPSASPEELIAYCSNQGAKPVAVRVVSKRESKVKSFHCLFKNTMKDKIQSANFWPENVLIKTFRLNDEAREWLKKLTRVDKAGTA